MIFDIIYSSKVYQNKENGITEKKLEHYLGRRVRFKDLNGKIYQVFIDKEELDINAGVLDIENIITEKIKTMDKFEENNFTN